MMNFLELENDPRPLATLFVSGILQIRRRRRRRPPDARIPVR
jgi:hypothetical protein